MKRWILLAAALYPRGWRAQFGEEFEALLDDVGPNWRVFANVLGGAIRMQMKYRDNWLRLIAATGVAGAIVAWGLSFTGAPHYVSTAVMSVTPQADPVRSVSPEVLRQRTAAHVAAMETELLSRTSLAWIIQDRAFDLYREERTRLPLEVVIAEMRRSIRVEERASKDDGVAPVVFSISFVYPDQMKAQAVVRELTRKFVDVNLVASRDRTDTYRNFWHDLSTVHRVEDDAPPPPVGDTVAVLDTAGPAMVSARGNRIIFLASGLGAGLALGVLAVLFIRRPAAVLKVGGFAAAGWVLAFAAAFLIPNRYTSTAVMAISQAVLTEDPLATSPVATSGAAFLREREPQVLSAESMARMIQNPRVDLYPRERARKPMEEVVRKILYRDLRISVESSPFSASGTASAFRISFSYSDPGKAQRFVQTMITAFYEADLYQKRALVKLANSDTLRQIYQRKAGENLEVLDPPSLTEKPDGPDRPAIAAAGLGFGLLLGVIIPGVQRPRTPCGI